MKQSFSIYVYRTFTKTVVKNNSLTNFIIATILLRQSNSVLVCFFSCTSRLFTPSETWKLLSWLVELTSRAINVLNIRQFVLRIRKGWKKGKNVPLSEILYMSIRECLNELGQYQRAILCHPFICYPAWNFFLKEPGILGFGMRNSPRWIRNPAEDWNPESLKFH